MISPERAYDRAGDIKAAVANIRTILAGLSAADAKQSLTVWPAFQRYLEIISEASRHLPAEWTAEHDTIPWRRIADLGNVLRHAYNRTSDDELWSIYLNDLDPLDAAVDRMLAAYGRL